MAGFSIATAATVLGVGLSAVGTINQIEGQKKAENAREAQQALAERRSRRQAIRRTQIARAQAVASSQASGGLNSSSFAGGVGSLSSRLGESIGFSAQMSGLNAQISAGAQQAQNGQFLSGLGGTAFNFGVNRGGLDFLNPQEDTITTPDFTT